MWLAQGRSNEARDLLAPVYQWFTEGFDTADLTAARLLLEDSRLRGSASLTEFACAELSGMRSGADRSR